MRVVPAVAALAVACSWSCGSKEPTKTPRPAAGDTDTTGGDHDTTGDDDTGGDQDIQPPTSGFIIYTTDVEECLLGCEADINQDLFRVDFDYEAGTATTTRLTENSNGIAETVNAPDDDIFRALSLDGIWLYFENALTGSSDILRMRADGSGTPERLTDSSADERMLALSESGDRLWYTSDAGGTDNVHELDIASGTSTNLSQQSRNLRVEGLMPDDTGVVLAIGDNGNDTAGTDTERELYVLWFDGPTLVRLTDNRVADRFAGLSPNGEWVIYRRVDDPNNDGVPGGPLNIWAARSDGSRLDLQLTEWPDGSIDVMAVTPKGDYVIYEYRPGASGGGSSKKQIYSVEVVDTPSSVQLTDPPAGESSYFRLLSADGGTVIYTTNDRPGGWGDIELYAIPTAGGDSILLTDFDNESHFLPRAHLVELGRILYDSPIDGDSELYSVPIGGGEIVNVTNNDHSDQLQGLSPDQEYLFYSNLADAIVDHEDQDILLTTVDGNGSHLQLTFNNTYDRLVATFWTP